MTQTLWLQLSLGGILGIALVLLYAGIRRRRHREWLIRLSSKYSLGVVEAGASWDARKLASMYEEKKGRPHLKDILVGSDDHGRFFAAERRRGRRREQILFFEPEEGTHVRGFSFSPEPRRAGFWRRHLLRRDAGRNGDSTGGLDFALHWSAPRPQWGDEQGLAVAARVLFHAARIIEESPLQRLHLRIDQRRVLVRCDRRLSGRELDQFLADATALRRRVLESLRRVRQASGHSGRGAPAASKRVAPVTKGTVEVLR